MAYGFLKDQLSVGYVLAASTRLGVLDPEDTKAARDIQQSIDMAMNFLEFNMDDNPFEDENTRRRLRNNNGGLRSDRAGEARANIRSMFDRVHAESRLGRLRFMSNESLFQRQLRRAVNGERIRGEFESHPRMKNAMRIGRIVNSLRMIDNLSNLVPGAPRAGKYAARKYADSAIRKSVTNRATGGLINRGTTSIADGLIK
jgi:hypothetical protein